MRHRKFGSLGWDVSEIGYGTWGMGIGPSSWKGSSDEESFHSLSAAVEQGVNFIDTAWIYGRGHSERLVGRLLRKYPSEKIYVTTKIPPKNLNWPSKRGDRIQDVFPAEHIRSYVDKSLENLATDSIDLMLFHVWEDDWHLEAEWQETVANLKNTGKVRAFGISVNTWEPWNVLRTLETGLIDAVEVIYNVFERRPEDQLFPVCTEKKIAIIARVPFDEGSLTGNIGAETKFDDDDWRSSYFVKENLDLTIPRVENLKKIVPDKLTLPQMALRFILENRNVATVIPGMRKRRHVSSNLAVSDMDSFDAVLLDKIKQHRWDRMPTSWSQ